MLPKLSLLVISLSACVSPPQEQTNFVAQLTANSVEDWVHVGGKATYTVTDGTVHGVGASGGNAFLHSPRAYADGRWRQQWYPNPLRNGRESPAWLSN